MKKRLVSVMTAVCLAFTLTGCVKIIDKGTEGEYTGEVAFDAAADSSSDWGQISAEIEEKAAEISEVMGSGIGSEAVAVKGTATVTEYIEKGPKHILAITPDGYDGSETFMLQIGSV